MNDDCLAMPTISTFDSSVNSCCLNYSNAKWGSLFLSALKSVYKKPLSCHLKRKNAQIFNARSCPNQSLIGIICDSVEGLHAAEIIFDLVVIYVVAQHFPLKYFPPFANITDLRSQMKNKIVPSHLHWLSCCGKLNVTIHL